MSMTEKERLLKVLSGELADRKPVICPGGMMTMASREVMAHTGCVWPDAHRNADKMATLSMAMHDEAGLENLGIPFCMTVEAEAWGGEVEDGDEVTEPCIVNYPLKTVSEWRNLKRLDPLKDGRLPIIIECTKILSEKRPDAPVIGNLVGPLSLATSLIDAITLFKALKREPEEVHAMLGFLTDNGIAYGDALIEGGADIITIADPSATGEILGPKLFSEFALPYLNRVIAAIHAKGKPVIVHICGDVKPIYEPLKRLDADCISVDSAVNMKDAKNALSGKRLMGNVSTRLLQNGPLNNISGVSRSLLDSVDILAPACGISAKTPVMHIKAMTEAAKGFMTDSVKVSFYPSRVKGIVPKGITILEAARMLGIGLEGQCNGTGKCSKCLVQVRTNKTLDILLACKTIVDADLEVIVPSHENKALKTVEHFHSESVASGRIDTIIKKEAVRDGETSYTKVYVDGKPVFVEVGDTLSISYGIALDIGTTTIVTALIDLNRGETVGSSSTLNPLVFYGHDVMSRIRYSVSQKDGLLKMHRELISALNLLIDVLTTDTGVKPENIYQLAAAGNTTMQHIFLNKEIAGIGKYPYRAEVLDTFTTTAKELAVKIADFAPVTTFPCISAYVGGDIVSGLLAIDLKESETPALFIDIGTNGEMALLLDGRIVATSTAAGPCFEGMTISSGMRAGPEAIEHVSFGEELSLEIIGGDPARGICGSGLLDLVAELIRTGLVNSRGRLQSRESSEVSERYKGHLFEKNCKRHFKLTDGISVSQEDIRQVQLAKAAIRAGVEILLDECNLKVEELKKIVVAGAFGYHLKESSLFGVGLLPELNGVSLSFVGNSSLGGAVRMLLDKGLIDDSGHIARTAENYDLSKVPGFEAAYVREMHF